ncbi:MAG: hypothetical protein DMF56_16525 [Acidobacteria bacterium]|nr:MAG: hypothetical protein DMF56_16525 [Acidobacteriota bacterium]
MRRFAFVALLALSAPLHAAIRGAVFSSDGTPVDKARVAAYRRETMIDWRERVVAGREREAIGSATTNAEGMFSIDTKVQGVVDVIVSRDGYAPKMQQVLVDDSELAIDLDAAATRSGRVTAGGKPVANAIVIAETSEGVAWSTRTDEKGSFTVPDPKRWTSALHVVHSDYAPLLVDATTNASLDIRLVPGASVRGRVLGSDRAPVAKAKLFAGNWPAGTTRDDGTFVIAHLDEDIKSIEAYTPSEFGSAKRAAEMEIKLETSHSISGVVRDAKERPLQGASVKAWPTQQPSLSDMRAAISDDKGNYRIESCGAKSYRVFADAPDLSFEEGSASLRNSRTARADFTAQASAFLTGTVIDDRKHPIAGAHVMMTIAQMPLIYALLQGEEGMPSARSGPDGRFRIAMTKQYQEFGDTTQLRLQATHPRYAIGVADLKDSAKPVAITLHDGIEVRGNVKDKDGNPVAGAAVILLQDPFGAVAVPLEMVLAGGHSEAFIESDGAGTFTVHLNETLHDLGVWKEGFAGFRLGGITPVKGQKPIEIVLQPGVEIRGRVAAKKSGIELEGLVAVESAEGMAQGTTAVASDGTFAVRSLRPGTYKLQYTSTLSRLSAEKVVKAPATDVVLELNAVGEIRGRVVDKATNGALPGFNISATNEAASSFNNGEFEGTETFMLAVRAGSVSVTATAPGYVSDTQEVTVGEEKPATVTFALTHGRTITGRVVNEHGLPIAKADISVSEQSIEGAQTADDGEFEIAGVPREPVKLDVQAQGFIAKSVDVEGDADRRVDVVLSAGRKVAGRVVTATGEPVEGAQVFGNATSGDGMQFAKSSADGTFTLEGLPDGRLSFRATRSDLGEAELEDVDPAATSVVIAFPPSTGTGTIHGAVKGFTEHGWTFGSVVAGAGSQEFIRRDGTYKLENVRAGDVELRAFAMTQRDQVTTAPVKATVVANQDIEVNLAFGTDIVLRGTVTEGGQPSAFRAVGFSGEQGMRRTKTNESGAYEITGLEPGLYRVDVETSQRQTYNTQYQLSGSATFDIAISFAQIHGRVVDETGAPQPGTQVEVSEHSIATDANGAFTISINEADAYVVTATKKGFATAVQKVSDARTPVVFTLVRSGGLNVRLTDARDGKTLDGYVVATNDAGLVAARANEQQKDGSFNVPLAAGAYRVSVSANGYASQSIRATVPSNGELRLALTPGGNLIVHTDKPSNDLVKLVMPSGEEYVRCQCNGIAEIRLTGTTTTIDHVAPGRYTMQVLDAQGRIKTGYPVAIGEGQTTTAEVHVPE